MYASLWWYLIHCPICHLQFYLRLFRTIFAFLTLIFSKPLPQRQLGHTIFLELFCFLIYKSFYWLGISGVGSLTRNKFRGIQDFWFQEQHILYYFLLIGLESMSLEIYINFVKMLHYPNIICTFFFYQDRTVREEILLNVTLLVFVQLSMTVV